MAGNSRRERIHHLAAATHQCFHFAVNNTIVCICRSLCVFCISVVHYILGQFHRSFTIDIVKLKFIGLGRIRISNGLDRQIPFDILAIFPHGIVYTILGFYQRFYQQISLGRVPALSRVSILPLGEGAFAIGCLLYRLAREHRLSVTCKQHLHIPISCIKAGIHLVDGKLHSSSHIFRIAAHILFDDSWND